MGKREFIVKAVKKLVFPMIFTLLLAGCAGPNIDRTQVAQARKVIDTGAPVGTKKDYPIYDIAMPPELQQYTYDLCEEYRLSYELVLGVIHTESMFVETADSGSSRGLMQISRGTGGWVSREAGITDFDPYNPRQNIAVGVWYLNYLRDYWTGLGCSDEDTFNLMLISYNRGIAGCREYVQAHGLENEYVDKVYKFKTELETGQWEKKDG